MTLQLNLPSMACAACGDTIRNAVVAIDPTATVQADLKTKQVNIETQTSEAAIKNAVEAVGYPVV